VNFLYHQTLGQGPDVVLLHGWGMHSGVWEDLVEALLDRYRVTILDLPGHGRSRGVRRGPTLADLSAAAVAAVAPPRATWIGWSLGGLVAQWLAINAPERVERLALVGSTSCFTQRPGWPHGMNPIVLRGFAEALRQNHRATLQRFIALEVQGSARAATQLRQLKALLFQYGAPDETALENGLAILESTDLRAELPRIACPTLLLLGQRDLLAPAAAGKTMRESLPDARLHVFPHAGHAPFLSHLPEFLTELRAFLDA
jgi:pimeloyl-[acyl-carrier protein] methyl ester esterase